jgi:predicted RNA polymerase sigma factor
LDAGAEVAGGEFEAAGEPEPAEGRPTEPHAWDRIRARTSGVPDVTTRAKRFID